MRIVQPELILVSKNPSYKVPYNSIVYSDLTPDESAVLLAVNADAILVSIRNLLSTEKGERLNLPQYGVNLSDALFDLMDDSTKDRVLTEVYNAVIAWEPRVMMLYGLCEINEDLLNHIYRVHLVFELVGLNQINIQYDGILTRSTSIMGTMYKAE